MGSLKYFTKYFNDFYGADGIYPIRDIKSKDIKNAILVMKKEKPNHSFEGDSVDREFLRDIIFTNEEINKAYKL